MLRYVYPFEQFSIIVHPVCLRILCNVRPEEQYLRDMQCCISGRSILSGGILIK